MATPGSFDPFESIIHRHSSADERSDEAAPAQGSERAKDDGLSEGLLDTIIGRYSAPKKDSADHPHKLEGASEANLHTQKKDVETEVKDEARHGGECVGRNPSTPSPEPHRRAISNGKSARSSASLKNTPSKPSRKSKKHRPRFVGSYILQADANRELVEHPECGIRCAGGGICCEVEQYRGNFGFTAEVMDLATPSQGDKIRECECSKDCPGYGRCCKPDEAMLSVLERKLLRPHNAASGGIEQWRAVLAEGAKAKRREVEEALICLSQTRSEEVTDIIEEYIPRTNTRLRGLAERAFLAWYLNADPPDDHDESNDHIVKDEVVSELEARISGTRKKIEEEMSELRRIEYRWEIAERLLARAECEDDRKQWETQCSTYHDMHLLVLGNIKELEDEIAMKNAMLSEIRA